MPNNDEVNAILQQLRARTEQRLSSDAPAAPKAAPAVSTANSAEELLQQLRAHTEKAEAAAAPAVQSELPAPVHEAAETPAATITVKEEKPAAKPEPVQPAEAPAAEEAAPAQPENSLPEPGIFAGIDTAEELVEDEATIRAREKAERQRLRESRKALLNKQRGGEKSGFFKTVGQILLFFVLVVAVILAVLYLLQALAGIEVIDVESIFDSTIGALLSAERLALKLP